MTSKEKKAQQVAPDIRGVPLSADQPLIKEETMILMPSIEALPLDKRPMVWRDLGVVLQPKYSRTAADMAYDFALSTAHQYQKCVDTRYVVPFDVELLARIYDKFPGSSSWQRPEFAQAFDALYGSILDGFPDDPKIRNKARISYARRMVALVGRRPTVAYRWITNGHSLTRRITNILSKLVDLEVISGGQGRELLESLAVEIWRLRGYDVNKVCPAVTPLDLAVGVVRNRRRGSVQEKVAGRLNSGATNYTGGAFG